jgi:hypothetical protein
MVKHFESPPIHDLPVTRTEGWKKALEGAALSSVPAAVACYEWHFAPGRNQPAMHQHSTAGKTNINS